MIKSPPSLKLRRGKRRKTKVIKIGNLKIGGNFPILVQSMTDTPTADVKKTVKQIKELEKAGCETVRVAVPDMASAQAIKKIKKKIKIPLVADIHFDWGLAVESILQGADKIRINPGNIGGSAGSPQEAKAGVEKIVKAAKKRKIPIRVGVNSGSLERDLLNKYERGEKAEALVESALRSIKFLESLNFKNIVVSLKSSDVLTTMKAYELLARKTDYPFHLGITEAGRDIAGITKSAIGIGNLLLKGIGDTIRVSLSDNPVKEVKAGWEILKSLGLREKGLTIISCPTCARSQIPVADIAEYIDSFSGRFEKPIKIAVMGCIVNGLGEARHTDLAIVGMGENKAGIFKKGKFTKRIEPKEIKSFLKTIENGCL